MVKIISKFFRNFRVKLFSGFFLLISFTVITALSSIYCILSIEEYNELYSAIQVVEKDYYNIRSLEKDFISEDIHNEELYKSRSSKNLKNQVEIVNELGRYLDRLKENEIIFSNNLSDEVLTLGQNFTNYEREMEGLVDAYLKRGYKDHGLVGNLRKNVYYFDQVETSTSMKLSLLTLRKNEKDYFLRKEKKYIEKFNNNIDDLKKIISENFKFSESKKQRLLGLTAEYKDDFLKVYEADKAIGHKNAGIMKKVVSKALIIEQDLIALKRTVNKLKNQANSRYIIGFIIALVITIITGLILSFLYISNIMDFVNKVKAVLESFRTGAIPSLIDIKRKDQLGNTLHDTNDLIQRITQATSYAKSIGKGDVDVEYDEKYKEDALAESLILMKNNLKENNIENDQRKWITEGLAEFAEIMRINSKDVEKLSTAIISRIVEHLGMLQGAIYIVNDEDPKNIVLDRVSTYAYSREKFEEGSIRVGEGLIGQCYLEKKKILLKDVPEEYSNIEAGLGDALPKFVLILPLMTKDGVVGILELASFEELEEYKVEFLDKLSESLAASATNVRVNEKTKRLLDETKLMTEQMSEQEEELKQNHEELMATQEEMERVIQSLQDENRDLRQQVKDLESREDN